MNNPLLHIRLRLTAALHTAALVVAALWSLACYGATPEPETPVIPTAQLPDSIDIPTEGFSTDRPLDVDAEAFEVSGDSLRILSAEEIPVVNAPEETKFTFTPDPTRAVWMSALCPGLGQLYNRRYWKLPIVVGAYMGLGYAMSWNNTMMRDYTNAYSDIMDNDPNTKSYMDFFPPTVNEADLDKTWLTNILRTRKNFYRRNRDLCIICMVGVYLLAMVDAYVDASLAHFDISPDLSMDVAPTLIGPDSRSQKSRPAVGVYWALTF